MHGIIRLAQQDSLQKAGHGRHNVHYSAENAVWTWISLPIHFATIIHNIALAYLEAFGLMHLSRGIFSVLR